MTIASARGVTNKKKKGYMVGMLLSGDDRSVQFTSKEDSKQLGCKMIQREV